MEFKQINREWVKTAAIIFLAVLLVLTFFSNTIMNRTLPEVATAYVTSGTITAKVRGSGKVSANGLQEVKAEQSREISSVAVKNGQDVKKGDLLFVYGEGESAELEEAQEALRQLELSYQRAALGIPSYDNALLKNRIDRAKERLKSAEEAKAAAIRATDANSKLDEAQIEQFIEAEDELAAAMNELEKAEVEYYNELYKNPLIESDITEAEAELNEAEAERDNLKSQLETLKSVEIAVPAQETGTPETQETEIPPEQGNGSPSGQISEIEALLAAAEAKVAAAQAKLDSLKSSAAVKARENMELCQAKVDASQGKLDAMRKAGGISEAYERAYDEWLNAKEELSSLNSQLSENNKSMQMSYMELSDINYQIEKQKEKIKSLAGEEENQVLAKADGTVQSISCVPGKAVSKGDVLCTIEVPDQGYTMSFGVTDDQARRLRVGDTATVSNFYWGNEIIATLESIKPNPQSPQSGKLLTFNLKGDVTTGSELTISVGEKSATYDVIIPNSSIRSDSNGSFVFVVSVNSSPLGNRYIVERVGIEVIASDDTNSAVSGGLNNGDYVITTSSSPVKNGDQVRMADT